MKTSTFDLSGIKASAILSLAMPISIDLSASQISIFKNYSSKYSINSDGIVGSIRNRKLGIVGSNDDVFIGCNRDLEAIIKRSGDLNTG